MREIEENRDESYIYPIDESILEDSLHDNSCKVCDRIFDVNPSFSIPDTIKHDSALVKAT